MRRFKVLVHGYEGHRKTVETLTLIDVDYDQVPLIVGKFIAKYRTFDQYHIKTIAVINDSIYVKGEWV